ncbi:MAG: GIY-YIG nuclease family protein [Candidatus Pacebacteria bacterium]|nr:GIY-YIG nuclease family protein [Candidatus Paceibacterota bacterium]
MYYIYILLLNNNQIYTGFTKNLKERFKEHYVGKVKSTAKRRPLKLIHYEAYFLKEDALRREKFLKTSDGKRFLKQQLAVFFKRIGKI